MWFNNKARELWFEQVKYGRSYHHKVSAIPVVLSHRGKTFRKNDFVE